MRSNGSPSISTRRYNNITLLDLRFTRPMRAGKLHLEPFVDAYNIFNCNTVITEVRPLGASLGRASQKIRPRIFRIGVKLNF